MSGADPVWTAMPRMRSDESRGPASDRALCSSISDASVYLRMGSASAVCPALPLCQRLQTKRSIAADDRSHCLHAPVLYLSYVTVFSGCGTDDPQGRTASTLESRQKLICREPGTYRFRPHRS